MGGALAGAPARASAPVRATAPALPDPGMPEEVLAEYRAHYSDVPVATLYARLMLMPARSALLREWGDTRGETFGGSWYDFRTGVWHILATTPAAAEAMSAQGRAAGAAVRAEVVPYSYKALFARAKAIGAGRDPLSRVGRVSGVDTKANRVTLAAPPERRTVRDPMVTYVDVTPPDAGPDHMCDSRRRCGRPLRSGVILWRETPDHTVSDAFVGPKCSLGFVARGSDGSRWALTAGHCIEKRPASQDPDGNPFPQTWGHGDEVIGTISAPYQCANTTPTSQCVDSLYADVARIRITNDYWINGGFGYVFGNPEPSTAEELDLHEALVYRHELEMGTVACLHSWHKNYMGAKPGEPSLFGVDNVYDCGVIEDDISDGSTHYMPLVTGAVSCPGDSGGGWVLYPGNNVRKAAGLNKNGTPSEIEPGDDPNPCSSRELVWFTSLDEVNDFFDAYSSVTIRVIHR